jgi:hypothetical protein
VEIYHRKHVELTELSEEEKEHLDLVDRVDQPEFEIKDDGFVKIITNMFFGKLRENNIGRYVELEGEPDSEDVKMEDANEGRVEQHENDPVPEQDPNDFKLQ